MQVTLRSISRSTPHNPRSFKERYEKMLSSKITMEMVREATDLLSQGEAVDPIGPSASDNWFS
jgi:hypothetical protein